MKTITANYQIVTPMFIGDADQKATTIRPTSVKGALRFWWRALYWSSFLTQKQNDAVKALHALHEAENRLFGSSNDGIGQGVFLLRITEDQTQQILKESLPKAGPGQAYLLGQGVYDTRATSYQRTALGMEGHFSVELCFKRTASDEEMKQLELTLFCFGLLGGLGSRARKGFGSIALRKIDYQHVTPHFQIPKNATEYKQFLLEHIFNANLTTQKPPFSAFSKQCRCDIYGDKKKSKPWDLLNEIGKEMQAYRSYGQRDPRSGTHLVQGQPAEQNFKKDHDLVYHFLRTRRLDSHQHPERVIFGMPHAYFFTSLTANKKADVIPDGAKIERRTSPLFIHVHQTPDGTNFVTQLILHADFLPTGVNIKIKGTGHSQTVPLKENWTVLTNYLDRFLPRSEVIYVGQ